MERESFCDQEVANVLNEYFIAIKVDKEERPDIDSIYMDVCQLLNGSGGWPLSIFMTCDQQPFFAGTYFPKETRYGTIGFLELLTNIRRLWKIQKDKLVESGQNIRKHLQSSTTKYTPLDSELFHRAYSYFETNFDSQFGGLGSAPKFPIPHHIYFLLRYAYAFDVPSALQMAVVTLTRMQEGGIYDHIGGGFSRYATDPKWLVPHFEKMLYDNALLTIAYTEAYQITGIPLFKQVASEIISYIFNEMTQEEGGFFTAQDADSEGEEGKYYLWSKDEITEILGVQDSELFCEAYDITEKGNFEGKNIPNLIHKPHVNLSHLREKLYQARLNRVPPSCDDKVLTAQNGMMIAALSIAGRVFQNEDYIRGAEKTISFIDNHMFQDNRLLSRFRNHEVGILAYADDYAYLIWGLIEAHTATGNQDYLEKASTLQNDLITLFWDDTEECFFLNGHDSEELITRPKNKYDSAIPSANAVSLMNMVRLARMTNKTCWQPYTDRMLHSFSHQMSSYGIHSTYLLCAYLTESRAPCEITLVDGNDPDHLKEYCMTAYLPFATIRWTTENDSYHALDGNVTAYVCSNSSCKPPTDKLDVLKAYML